MVMRSISVVAVATLMVTTALAQAPSPQSDRNDAKIAMVTAQSSDQWLPQR
jgi:hypothetical protein